MEKNKTKNLGNYLFLPGFHTINQKVTYPSKNSD